jgi:cytochrome P450
MPRDVRLARMCLHMSMTALARNVVRNAQSRLTRSRARHVQTTEFDPFDPVTAADPYPQYRVLLGGQRVHYNPKRDVYILSRYADVRAAARDHSALSSAGGVTFSRLGLPSILTSDPPTHTRMRKHVVPGFTRGALESWRQMIDQIARELVAELSGDTPVDVVAAIAEPMPMRTITYILGVATADQDAFRDWSNLTARVTDVNFSISGLRQLMPCFKGFRHLYAFFTDALSQDGLLGEETVLGRLVRQAGGGRVSDDELFFFALLLVLGGHETTSNLLSTLFATLADYPDQLRLLQHRPDLIPSAIEEQLRFASPIQNFYRTARADYPVGPAIIPAGSRVMLAWGAANRDPRQFDAPDVFRADRNPVGHLAFGHGIHLCLGAQLARMQGQAVLREIVDNFDRIEVAGPPTWSTNANLRGPTRLDVRVTPRGR